MATVYDFAVRALACINCGAPLTVPPTAGEVQCGHCRSSLVIEARRVEGSRPEGAPLPDSAFDLQPFMDSTGLEGKPWSETVPRFRALWEEARSQEQTDQGYRLYCATMMLAAGYGALGQDLERRTVLETAVELLPDRGHRCVLRCLLARAANKLGDREAARAWFSQCSAEGLSKAPATEVRVTEASLSNAWGDQARVLELVPPPGQAEGSLAGLGAQLRIDALEKLGRHEQARAELRAGLEQHGDKLSGWMAINDLAPRTRASLESGGAPVEPVVGAPSRLPLVMALVVLVLVAVGVAAAVLIAGGAGS